MPNTGPVPARLLHLLKSSSRRQAVADALRAWNRHQALRIIGGLLVLWLVGTLGLFLAEHRTNPAFRTVPESLWSVWLMLFSGLDEQPTTNPGRLLVMLVLIAGVGLVGLFTGTVASVLVEQQLRRREVANFEMEDHLVLCNWAPRGLLWIQEVHSKIVQKKRPVVIIHENPDEIVLPDHQEDPAFQDVYIVRGDPTNEVILRRARVPRAHSVVVFSDDRLGDHADGKSILTCIAISSVCKGGVQPNIAVECRNPAHRHHLKRAGADEIISSDELGLRLLARSALYHGMTHVYQELLTVGRDANELYVMPVPPEMVGRDFVEASSLFLRHRQDKRSCLLIGLQRGEEMILNPIGPESGALKEGDMLVLLSRVFLNTDQALPTVPPLVANPSGETPK
jgi:voltage-gated potassium channel